MVEQGTKKMDPLELILDEVRQTRIELREHIKDETAQFGQIKEDIHAIETTQALTKQRGNIVNAGIASIVAGVISVFVVIFGKNWS